MAEYPSFIGPTYTTRSRRVGIERAVNLYLEKSQSSGAKVPWSLVSAPGLRTMATAPLSPGRGLTTVDTAAGSRMFGVWSYGFYEVLGDHTFIQWGTVAADDRPVVMKSNGEVASQLLIASGGQAYVFNLETGLFTTVLTSGVTTIDYLDGYFLAVDAALGSFRLSDLADGLVWSLLQQQQRNAAPEPWITARVSQGLLWLFGVNSTDVWQDTGESPFPFAPIPNARMDWGIAAIDSVVVLETPIWLARGKDGLFGVVQAQGYAPVRISTHAVEQAINGYSRRTRIDDAEAFSYAQDGHLFYVLTFPTAQATWVYDLSTGQWHERMTLNPIRGEEQAYRARAHAYCWGHNYAVDRLSGALIRLDPTYGYDVGGTPLRRIRRAPHVQAGAGRERLFVHRFGVDLDVGIADQTGQGADPQLMFRLSPDGGNTYSPEYTASMGLVGDYRTTVDWYGLGEGDSLVFEIAWTDPVLPTLTGAVLDLTPGY